MKKRVVLFLIMIFVLSLSACGKSYTCRRCNKTTSKIYYDIDGDAAYCGECAKDYWAPFDYKEYKAN